MCIRDRFSGERIDQAILEAGAVLTKAKVPIADVYKRQSCSRASGSGISWILKRSISPFATSCAAERI